MSAAIEPPQCTSIISILTAKKSIRHFSSCFKKNCKLTVKLGCKSEPKWTTYFKLLYPDAAKLQTVRNKENIEKL